MSTIQNSTLEQLIEQIHVHSGEWLLGELDLEPWPQLILRKWSLILRFKSRSREYSAILVKITRHQGGSIETAVADNSLVARTVREFEMLRSVEKIFSTNIYKDVFCYIRPLAVLEKWNALITEELDCEPLKNYLLRVPMLLGMDKPWMIFELLLERSARWLSIYHQEMGSQESVLLSQTKIEEELRQYFAQLSEVLGANNTREFDRIVDLIFTENHVVQVPMAVLHGDFHCSNLLVTPDLRIGSLDAESEKGPIYVDIAKLLADLETRSLQVFTFGALLTSRRMKSSQTAVLRGYFASTPLNNLLLELFIVAAILQKWKIDEDLLVYSSLPMRVVRKILSPFRRRYMHKILLSHLNNLEKEFELVKMSEDAVMA